MKKILLGTTALIGAATLVASAVYADDSTDPKVTIGGFSTFEAGYSKSDDSEHSQSTLFRNDTEIHFNVAGKTGFGLGYGAEVDLNADIGGGTAVGTPGYNNTGLNAHRTYGWLQGDQWGHVEFGSNDGAASTLKVDASNIARATGGINGDWEYFAQANGGKTNPAASTSASALQGVGGHNSFITSANLPLENGPSTSLYTYSYTNNTKVTYYTPRFAGFQLGVSYAPNLNQGQDTSALYSDLQYTNIWSGGLNYQNTFDQIGVAAAVTGESAHYSYDPSIGTLNDVKAWNAGAKVSYMGFSLAGSYGSWDKSADVDGVTADYWTGGLAYETGPIGASVTYLGSEDKYTGSDNKFQDVSFGVDYKLAPGLTPFVEYTWYDINPTGTGAAAENKGNVVLVGSQLSF